MAWVREREAGFKAEIEREAAARAAASGEPWTFSYSSFESEGRAAASHADGRDRRQAGRFKRAEIGRDECRREAGDA